MPGSSRLLAWIEPFGDGEYLAAFVGEGAAEHRAPATQLCSSGDVAREWVEGEAAAIDVAVEWVTDASRR